MSARDDAFARCFDDLAQIDADLRALEAGDLPPRAAPPARIGALMRDCCLRLRQQRESLLVRLQMGLAPAAARTGGRISAFPACRPRRH